MHAKVVDVCDDNAFMAGLSLGSSFPPVYSRMMLTSVEILYLRAYFSFNGKGIANA